MFDIALELLTIFNLNEMNNVFEHEIENEFNIDFSIMINSYVRIRKCYNKCLLYLITLTKN